MMKTLRYLFLAVLTMTFGMAQADDDIVIDFNAMTNQATSSGSGQDYNDAGDYPNGYEYTQNGVTFTVSANPEGGTPPRFWSTNKGPQLRVYKGTVTITSTSSMKSITFNTGTYNEPTPDTGAMDGKTWKGTGDTKSVVFTLNGQIQFNTVTITPGVGEGGGEEPPVEEDPTFDFTKYDYGLLHTVSGQTEDDPQNGKMNKDYYLENGTTFTSGEVIGTLSGNNPARLWETTEGVTEFRLYKAGTLTLSVPSGQVITKVVFAGATVSGLCGPDGKTLTDATWEGSLNAPAFTCTGTQKINTITVTYGPGTEIPIEVEYTDMTMREATAKSLEGTAVKNINLKLNNALVVHDFVKGNSEGFFVREGDFAIEFYNTGLGLKAGQTITGSIKCNLSPYNYTPEVVKADDAEATNLDNVTLGTGTVTPTEMTADETFSSVAHLADLVLVKEAPVITEENQDTGALMYYVQCTGYPQYDSEENFTGYGKVRIYDYFGGFNFPTITPTAVPTYDVKAIYVGNGKTTRRLWVLAMNASGETTDPTAIQAINAEQADGAVFNLQGQRVSQPTHGIYIVNGKKIMIK